MADQEWAKRVRAAAAYSGIGLADLAAKLGMSDSTLRRHLAAAKRPHEIRALCQTVAEITDLPDEFFTIDFGRLPELVVADEARLAGHQSAYDELSAIVHNPGLADGAAPAAIARAVLELRAEVAALRQSGRGEALEDLTRRTKRAVADPEVDDAQATPAAAGTQSEEASTPEVAQSRAAARRRSGGRTDA